MPLLSIVPVKSRCTTGSLYSNFMPNRYRAGTYRHYEEPPTAVVEVWATRLLAFALRTLDHNSEARATRLLVFALRTLDLTSRHERQLSQLKTCNSIYLSRWLRL